MAELGDSLALIAGEKAGIIKRRLESGAGQDPSGGPGGDRSQGSRGRRPDRGARQPGADRRRATRLPSSGSGRIELGRRRDRGPRARHCTGSDGSGHRADHLARSERALAPKRPGADPARLRAQSRRRGRLIHALDPSVLGDIESRKEIVLVFGALSTKNWRAMLRRLETVAGHRVYVAPPISKGGRPERESRLSCRVRWRTRWAKRWRARVRWSVRAESWW